MKKRTSKCFSMFLAAIMMIAAFVVPAYAATSVEDQMAANSAAWWVAYNAGDQETMDALHAANQELASQAAGSSGSTSFDSNTGTWDVTTSSGSNISSSGSYSGGKSNTITYTTTTSSGSTSSTSNSTYTSSSIDAYMNYGGTNQGLQDSYNNAAYNVTTSGNYGVQTSSASEEVAVAQALLGLTDAEAQALQEELEASKQAYESASAAYKAAVAAGDEEAAAEAQAAMQEAHDAAQDVRASYGYTGDSSEAEDGGYYYDEQGNKVTYAGGFYITNIQTSYKIEASCNEGGTISPAGTVNVTKGNDQAFVMTPKDGYEIKSVLVDGEEIGKVETYTFTNVRSAHTIVVTFAPKELTITASAGTGGSISPSGSVKVTYGDDKSFTITPNEGYDIKSVTVDGKDKGKITSYTFEDVKEAHTISATFVKKTFQITASAGAGGSISPNGTSTVSYGDSKTFTITPNQGYKVKAVMVDGTNKGELTSYTFSNVKAAHTISVTFEPSGKVDMGKPSVTDGDGGKVSGGSDGEAIKSGYGIFAKIPVTYSDVTDLKVVVTYNFGKGTQTVELEETGKGIFEYPVNAESPLGNRCIYIPVETADGSYTLTFTVTAKNAAGEVLSDTQTATVVVKGNMYEDDFTGDS